MLQTPLCSLLGIRVPIIQGALGGPWPPSVRLAAAVSGAGALGSLATALRSAEQVREDIAALRDRTDEPYAVNHTMKPFVEDVFAEILRAAPPVVSFALGCRTAEAVEAGADVIVAQGSEAGGFGGGCSTMVLVPQVVDEVAPVPVVAAGGIADGRGLAAALALGAQGVNVGTRFIASEEAELTDGYKAAVLAARSDDTLRAAFVNDLLPAASEGAYATSPRVVRTSFVDEWHGREDEVRKQRGVLGERMRAAMADGAVHELLVITGEVAGSIREILPAGEIVRRMAAEAESIALAMAGA